MVRVGGVISGIPVALDRAVDTPLPVQLAAALRDAIDREVLRPGEGVPPTRALARRLDVARGVVVSAYEQLIAEGYLSATRGSGTIVHPDLAATSMIRGAAHFARETEDAGGAEGAEGTRAPGDAVSHHTRTAGPLSPGSPIASAIESPAWRAAWRGAAAEALTIAPPIGDPQLREEIADHLRRMRGTVRSPNEIIVTAGTRDGLGLLLTALGSPSGRNLVVGVEDPGLPTLRGVAARYGAQIVALPTDADGVVTSALPAGILDVVIVTPSHQYPLGGSLSLARRRELLAWARATGVIVVEDDFDSELRYAGSPLPALAALDDPVRGAVVLLGTFSRTVAPAISAGYIVAPAELRARLASVRDDLGGPVSAVVQRALARYLASGELRRHTARLLRRYAERRDLVSERFAGCSGVRVRPMDGGLHAVLEFVGGDAAARETREAEAVQAATQLGLGVAPLGAYWERQGAGLAGLVVGLGASDDVSFDRALVQLREVLDGLTPRA